MLEVRDLSVAYGATTALDGVEVVVGDHEIVAVLGASGSGKTTLLRTVAGLEAPVTGRILWDGDDLTVVPTHRRRFGLVFQDFALFPHLDVAGNVGFGLRMSGLPAAVVADRVAAALERVGLGGLGRRRIDELSGGQAQRVALARTLAPEPRMLLLDEPLGSLDPALRRHLAADLAATLAAAPVPTLLVTHDVDEAFALADRITVLDGGQVVGAGTPEALWRHPGRTAVARLLGHGVVSEPLAGITPPAGCRLAVRSDGLRESPAGPIAATVVASAFRGPGYETTVGIGRDVVTAATPQPHRPGATLRLEVDPEAVSVVTD